MSRTLRGYAAAISNTMDKTTTTGSEPLLFGDFSNFVIVDRLGLSTEFIPQLFNASGNPLGRRGVYARWRNDTGVLVQNAFRLLRIA
jgi:HK97 family phage major capsid protein